MEGEMMKWNEMTPVVGEYDEICQLNPVKGDDCKFIMFFAVWDLAKCFCVWYPSEHIWTMCYAKAWHSEFHGVRSDSNLAPYRFNMSPTQDDPHVGKFTMKHSANTYVYIIFRMMSIYVFTLYVYDGYIYIQLRISFQIYTHDIWCHSYMFPTCLCQHFFGVCWVSRFKAFANDGRACRGWKM